MHHKQPRPSRNTLRTRPTLSVIGKQDLFKMRTTAMYEPYSHLVHMGRVASNPAKMDLSINEEVEDDVFLKERSDKRRVSFSIPIDFLDALERLKDPTLPHYSGKADADARGELSTCQEVQDFFFTTCDPADLRALSGRVDAELVRNDWMMRKAMLLDLWRRTARKYANRNKTQTREEKDEDPYSKFIIHEQVREVEVEEKKVDKERMKKRSVYYLTQLFQYAVRRMIWERRRLSSSSDPWDTFFYRAYAAKKPTEDGCARIERKRRPRVELAHKSTDADDEAEDGQLTNRRSSSIIIDPATVVAMEMERSRKDSDESSSDDEAETVQQPPEVIERSRRQSLSDLMIRKRREQSLAALDAAPEQLQQLQPAAAQLAVPAAEPERVRRPSEPPAATGAPRPRRPSQRQPQLPLQQRNVKKDEVKQPAFAIMKQEEIASFKQIQRRDKPRVPLLPPINPAPRHRASTINIPVNMSRSRSSPHSTSRMRFGRPPHSPDGRNQLTRLFYLPLIPPRSTGSHQWPGHDIDRVIRALAS